MSEKTVQVEQNEDGTTEEAVGTQNDSRLARLAEIEARNNEARADEFDDVGETEPESSPSPPSDEAVTPSSDTPAEKPAEPQKRKYKVNGQDVELTDEQAAAIIQKVASADQYLAEAARIRQMMIQAAQAKQTPPQPSEQDTAASGEEDPVALARALQMGSEEEAAKAIKRITDLARRAPAQQQPAQPNLSDVEKIVDLIETKRWFTSEYNDVLSDPYLQAAAFAADAQMVASGDQRSVRERWKAIGDDIRDKFLKKPEQTFEAKKQAKSATVVNLPTASKRAQTPVEDDSEENPSDVIAGFAKARGQRM